MARLPHGLHIVSRPGLPPDASPGHQSPPLDIEGPTVQDVRTGREEKLNL